MISYCVCVYRPRLFYILLEDLIRKTTSKYEILVWINCRAPEIEGYIERMAQRGVPVKIVGASPDNIGMLGYKMLFRAAKYDLIAQVHDDVICVSRNIAERAQEIVKKTEGVKQIVADVVQDAFTTGGKPGPDSYKQSADDSSLLEGPLDGWFSIYDRSVLPILLSAPYQPYFYLGSYVAMQVKARGFKAYLCSAMKVFHVAGPAYARFFETVDSEVRKLIRAGNVELAEAYGSKNVEESVLDQMAGEYRRHMEELENFGRS